MRDIGKNIRDLREAAGLTQEELARRLFVTRQTVSNYELGRSRPDLDMLLRIAEELKADVNTVLYGVPPTLDRKALTKAASLFAAMALAALPLHRLTGFLRNNYYLIAPDYTLRTVYDPLLWLVAGWLLVTAIFYFRKIKEPPRKAKALRILAAVLLACFVIRIPMLIFNWVAFFRVLSSNSVSMHFPNIPVYSQLEYLLFLLCYKYSAVFILPGAILRALSGAKESPDPS